jgi:thiol-disulfide isomerase/thioredoxin
MTAATARGVALALTLAALASMLAAQTADEQRDLNQALAQAGASPVEHLRALEKHLQKYPDSPRRAELERAAARAAIEAHDGAATVLYGERVLARQAGDLAMLDGVAQALLTAGAADAAQRALRYALRIEELYREMKPGESADRQNQMDRGIGHALTLEARAAGGLGRAAEALTLARRAFETFPDAESAREIARWCERLGKIEDAARALADAFTITDPRSTDADRAADRLRMGELYQRANGSPAGLGDLVLEAYDGNVARQHARQLRLRQSDPNAQLTDPLEFTLTAPDGGKLVMAGLKGKVVVLDFWATWCGPCRAQHPLYAQAAEEFRDNPGVVFLSINADDDRALVKRFLDEAKWPDAVYFEDGLTRALGVFAFPTTIVLDRRGQVFSRLNGYVPERYVETLTGRVRAAVSNQGVGQ